MAGTTTPVFASPTGSGIEFARAGDGQAIRLPIGTLRLGEQVSV